MKTSNKIKFKLLELNKLIKSKICNYSTKDQGEDIVKTCLDNTFFSWSAQSKISPLAIKKAEGCYLYDYNDNKIFDLSSQLICSNIGHGNKEVIESIKKQADELAYAGASCATSIRADLSKFLKDITPGDLNKFFFTLGGAEANENALKFAKFYTKRNKIVSRYKSYHGATLGAASVSGDFRRWPLEPCTMPGVIRTFDPYKYRSLFYNESMKDEEFSQLMIDILEEQLKYENPESVAAVIIETVTGSNGIIPPPEGYLLKLRKLCDKYGILLICDEVMAGFGRTGKWFAVDHWDVVPDIITMAKGITSAYLPLGVVAVSNKIAKEFDNKVFFGGLTYQCHPICMSVAYSCLNYMKNNNINENSKYMGDIMIKLMNELKKKHICIGDVRSIGLFGGIEFVNNRKTKEVMQLDKISMLVSELKKANIFTFNVGNVLMCSPPLIVKPEELKECFNIIDEKLFILDQFCNKV